MADKVLVDPDDLRWLLNIVDNADESLPPWSDEEKARFNRLIDASSGVTSGATPDAQIHESSVKGPTDGGLDLPGYSGATPEQPEGPLKTDTDWDQVVTGLLAEGHGEECDRVASAGEWPLYPCSCGASPVPNQPVGIGQGRTEPMPPYEQPVDMGFMSLHPGLQELLVRESGGKANRTTTEPDGCGAKGCPVLADNHRHDEAPAMPVPEQPADCCSVHDIRRQRGDGAPHGDYGSTTCPDCISVRSAGVQPQTEEQ